MVAAQRTIAGEVGATAVAITEVAALGPDGLADAGSTTVSREVWIAIAIVLLVAAVLLIARLLRATRAPPASPGRSSRPAFGVGQLLVEHRGEIAVGLLALGAAAATAYFVISAPV